MKNSKSLLPHTGEGIVIDIGTGDGRFVSAMARAHPNKFFIGVDANVKPLEKPSMKATRKPNKGGLVNVMFVQAAVEDLPEEFDGIADEIHIHFPWGSLLRAVATGEAAILGGLRRVAAPGCVLEVVIGIDPERDHSEITRLALPTLDKVEISRLEAHYADAGFELVSSGEMDRSRWTQLQTTWASRLGQGSGRTVTYLRFSATAAKQNDSNL